MRILVTWGSRRGGTEGIARIIGEELREAGHDVVLGSAREVVWSCELDAVVVGGALYGNRWHHHARRFVRRHERQLRDLPVWMFSSGPLDDRATHRDIAPTKEVRALMDRVGAQGHATFGGRLAADARGLLASAMAKKGACDYREPTRIRAWASAIARALPSAEPYGAIAMPGSSLASIAAHALVGWAACAAAMAVAPNPIAPIVHAIAAPLVFALVARRYFRLRGARGPLFTAGAMVAVFALLEVALVAGVAHQSFTMFESAVGTWLPLALVFAVTWAVGATVFLVPAPEREVADGSILIVVGHPSRNSFTAALAEAYREGADGAAQILYVGDLAFDPSLHEGYRREMPLEPDLVRAQDQIRRARHLVFFHPQWWGAMPAILKGFLDRVFLPGFAFRHHARDPLSDGLLAGRSGEIWLTSDAPRLWYFLKYWNAPVRAMKTATLEFCGVRPVAVTDVDRVRYLDVHARRAWLYRARAAGEDAAAKLARGASRPARAEARVAGEVPLEILAQQKVLDPKPSPAE